VTAQDNIEFAKQAYDAMTRGDIEWMVAHMHPDVRFVQGGRFPTAGTYEGRDAMLGHFMEFMTMVEGNFSLVQRDYLASDDRVAVLLTVTIGYKGETLEFDEVHVWRVADDLLLEMHAIPFDPYAVDAFLAGAA
jgi:ketosteroid isomerase-like protein